MSFYLLGKMNADEIKRKVIKNLKITTDTILGPTLIDKIGNIIAITISFIPVVGQIYDLYQIFTIALDIADIYGFAKTVSRDALNESRRLTDEIFENTIRSSDVQAQITETVKSIAEGRPEDEINKIVKSVTDNMLSKYKTFAVKEDLEGCYSDPNERKGAPTSTCNEVYKSAYNKYSQENIESYLSENTTQRLERTSTENGIEPSQIENKYETDSKIFRILSVVGLILIFIFILSIIHDFINL